MSEQAEAEQPRGDDPLRLATPRIDDVEARRARASVASKLFGGPKQPVRVGRYQVLGRIGAGGMGVVYRAHDPELARDVAVKFMNSEAGNAEVTTAQARLVREARAMARLAHPNVIHVYDVGTVDDGVFIAMELVEGESLATWLAREHRDWLEVLRRYVDAGRGLAAAHAAGVVHRDFKPENVLVGIDGRVRVGDFGLAGAPTIAGAPSLDELRSADAELDEASMSGGALTRTGALLGTPKYMAPEQEHGALASARSDQFSFCVALYEGLYGRPPFEGDTIARYRRNVRHGKTIAPPLDTKVKSWVHAEIMRGMSIDPAERHPGMEVLLDKLARALVDPRIARSWMRRIAFAVPLAAVALGIGALVGAQRGEGMPAVATMESDDGSAEQLEPVAPSIPEDASLQTPAPSRERAEGAQARTTSAESSPPADAKSAPSVGRERKAALRPKGKTCYWKLTNQASLGKRPKWMRRITFDGTCYKCEEPVPETLVKGLEPRAGCSSHFFCVKDPEATCDDQAAG